MDKIVFPFYAKSALIAIAGFGLIFALYAGQSILLPLLYATIFAVLLNPFVNYLTNKKCNRVLAISLAVMLMFFVMLGVFFLISTQVSMVVKTYPELLTKTEANSSQIIQWISTQMDIEVGDINTRIKSAIEGAISDLGPMVGRTLLSLGSSLFILLLMPVYLFLILFYKSLLLEFLRKLFHKGDHIAVVEVLVSTKGIIQSYLVGLMVEMLVVAILNSVGLLLLGIDYAIILGITGAILNLIPYLGGVVAVFLPMAIAFVTKDSLLSPVLVLIVYTVIQFIDNNFIVPKVVASKVQINALVSIVVVIIGGALWGVPGMFLSIPLTAIMKVVFDHIEIMKPWGFLLGNIVPTTSKFTFPGRKKAAQSS